MVSMRGTCCRRHVGAIIVKNDRIVSTGYVGSPRGEPNCTDSERCLRKELNVPSGKFYEICVSVHAEENALINAANTGVGIDGATLYIYSAPRSLDAYPKGQLPKELYLPCFRCKKMIINSGIKKIVALVHDKITTFTIDDLKKMLCDDIKKHKQDFLDFKK